MAGIAATAFASSGANQVKGGSYTGALQPASRDVNVSFTVSGNGKQVTSLKTSNVPLYCSGGGPAIPTRFKNATISANGSFTSTAQNIIKVGPFKGQVGEKLTITGKFVKGRSERGTLTTTYPKLPSCSGKSPYSTKA
jgi:hypothetical protein